MSNESEYRLDFFHENGYNRRSCKSCKTPFWTKDKDREFCADIPCTDYFFFDIPIKSGPLSVSMARSKFISFFQKRGHTPVPPRPVLARWRDDLYLTIASIVDFQPHVTSGLVPPPANPLVVSQPSIRLEDIDNVGVTFGRHLTMFEMAAHHAFNYPDKRVYWKEETTAYARDFFVEEIGIPEEQLNFKESWWEGGGNAGPCLEVTVGGLELATLVFMQYKKADNGYEPLPLKIVDTGYGVERIAWFTQRTPTAFHAIFGDLVPKFFQKIGVPEPEGDLLAKSAYFAGKIDPDVRETVLKHRKLVAESLGVPVEKVNVELDTAARVFQVLDHTRTLAVMLADGLVPSNSGEGYLGRLVIRRTLRVLRNLRSSTPLSGLVELQVMRWGEDFPQMLRNKSYILEVVRAEEEKFNDLISRSSQIISSTLRKGSVNEETLVKLYDSNGIPPDLVVEEAEKRGINVSLPHNFYAQVARLHSTAPIKGKGGKGIPASLLQVAKDLPKTRRAYYEDQYARSINAKVLYSKDGYVVLDSTVFYPEGGGQIGDTGYLVVGERKYRVSDTQIVDGVIFHRVDEAVDLPIGSSVSAVIDWDRRFRIMRHHTVTHVILSAARKVLGDHVWQAGAEKTEEKGRLDLTHFKVPTKEEVRKIEELANSVILDRRPVRPMVVDRIEAETKYGMSIYAGGVQMMKDIRLLNIEGWDIEACGGTHVSNTSEIGGVKVINVEKIQDGVIRLEYVAGDRVVVYAQRQEDLIEDIGNRVGAGAADVLKRTEKIVDTLEKDESLLRMYRQDYVKVLEGRAQMREYGNYRVYWIGKFFDQEVVESFMRQVTSKGKTAVVHVFQDGEVTRLDIALSPDISGKEITSAIVKMGSCRGGGRGSRLVYTCQGISEEEVRKKLEEIITKTLH